MKNKDIVRDSLIDNILYKLFNKYNLSLKSSIIFNFLHNILANNGFFVNLFEKIKRKIIYPFKRVFSAKVEESILIATIGKTLNYIPQLHLKSVGTVYFVYGIIISIIKLSTFLLNKSSEFDYDIIASLSCTVIAAILMASSSTIKQSINNSIFLSFVNEKILCLDNDEKYSSIEQNVFVEIVIGLVLTGISFITNFYLGLLIIPSVLVLLLIFIYPHIGIALSILTSCYYNSIIFNAILICTFASTIVKILQGKRNIKIGYFAALWVILFTSVIITDCHLKTHNYAFLLLIPLFSSVLILNKYIFSSTNAILILSQCIFWKNIIQYWKYKEFNVSQLVITLFISSFILIKYKNDSRNKDKSDFLFFVFIISNFVAAYVFDMSVVIVMIAMLILFSFKSSGRISLSCIIPLLLIIEFFIFIGKGINGNLFNSIIFDNSFFSPYFSTFFILLTVIYLICSFFYGDYVFSEVTSLFGRKTYHSMYSSLAIAIMPTLLINDFDICSFILFSIIMSMFVSIPLNFSNISCEKG